MGSQLASINCPRLFRSELQVWVLTTVDQLLPLVSRVSGEFVLTLRTLLSKPLPGFAHQAHLDWTM